MQESRVKNYHHPHLNADWAAIFIFLMQLQPPEMQYLIFWRWCQRGLHQNFQQKSLQYRWLLQQLTLSFGIWHLFQGLVAIHSFLIYLSQELKLFFLAKPFSWSCYHWQQTQRPDSFYLFRKWYCYCFMIFEHLLTGSRWKLVQFRNRELSNYCLASNFHLHIFGRSQSSDLCYVSPAFFYE